MKTAILLLAAGSSSRMGQSKQLVKIKNETLLERSVKEALKVSADVFVVLGASFEAHRLAIESLPVVIVENKEWKKGIGHSLKVGLARVVASTPPVDAVLILVCDQPLLTAEHLNKLVAASKAMNKPVVASAYGGIAGVPALFVQSFFGKLSLLGDEEGARKIIRQAGDAVVTVDFPAGSVDLDTLDDVNRFADPK